MADKKPKQGGGTTPDPRFKTKISGSDKTIMAKVKGGQRVPTKATKGGSSGGGKK